MKVEFLVQDEEINLNKIIENEILNDCSKAYFVVSDLKESGFEIIEEHIIDTKVSISMLIGINKKNTTKKLLENILEYSKEVYYYDNNKDIEFESNILVFENSKQAKIYICSGSISDCSLTTDKVLITKLIFDLKDAEDKKEYKLKINNILKIKNNGFEVLKEKNIQELMDKRIIFSNKQYQHNAPSISEFLGKKDKPKEEVISKTEEIKEDVFIELPKVVLNEIDFDFDIEDAINTEVEEATRINENVKKEREVIKENIIKEKLIDLESSNEVEENLDMDIKEAINLDDLLFTKSDVKLDISKDKDIIKKEEVSKNGIDDVKEQIKSKKIDLNSVTNYIYELTNKKLNDKETDMLKIPNYIKTLIPKFFEFEKTNKLINEGVEYKSRDLEIEIIDAKNNNTYMDDKAKMMQKKSQTYFVFQSDKFKEVEYEEGDIARINKISENKYRIEIISKDLQEYRLWSKMTTMDFKNSTKKYGVM